MNLVQLNNKANNANGNNVANNHTDAAVPNSVSTTSDLHSVTMMMPKTTTGSANPSTSGRQQQQLARTASRQQQQQLRRRNKPNSLGVQIDESCRILFPVNFLAFNIFYWWYYLYYC